jgi:RimJ/RimL family protein N-acetyltransferase
VSLGSFIKRDLRVEDANLLLEWRNQPGVFELQRNQRLIVPEEHLDWITRRIQVLRDEPFLVYTSDDLVLAFVRFDSIEASKFEVSIVLNPSLRGKKISKTILGDAIAYIQEKQVVKELVATIHVSNQASLRLFSGLGFTFHTYIRSDFVQMRKARG